MRSAVLLLGVALGLLLLCGFLFSLPLDGRNPLEVYSLQSVEHESDGHLRVTLSGKGFDKQTRVSLLPDIGNQHLFRGQLPLPGMLNDMTRSGHLLLLTDVTDGLIICDISQPAVPTVLATLPLPGHEWRVAVAGSIALVLSADRGLHLVDISVPERPELLSTYPLTGFVRDLACDGTRAYIAASDAGVLVVDFSQPRSPRLIKTLKMADRALGVTVTDDKLLVAQGREGLLIYRIAADGRLTLEKHLEVPGRTSKGALWHQGVLVQTGENIYLFPEGKRDAIALLGPGRERPLVLTFNNDHIFLGTIHGLMVLKWNGTDAEFQGLIATTGSVKTLCLSRGWLFVGDARTGLKSLPVPGDGALQKADILSISNRTAFFKRFDDYMLIADRISGLQVFDASRPDYPRPLSELYANFAVLSMARGSSRIYLGLRDKQLLTLERLGTKIMVRSSIQLPNVPRHLAVRDHFLLVADQFYGAQVYSLDNPDHPKPLGTIASRNPVHDFAFNGPLVFTAEGPAGVGVAELRQGEDIRQVSHLSLLQSAVAVAVCGRHVLVLYKSGQLGLLHQEGLGKLRLVKNLLSLPETTAIAAGVDCFYLRTHKSGLIVLRPSVNHPDSLSVSNTIALNGRGGALRVDNEWLLVADQKMGMLLFSLAEPESPRLIRSIPLSFNAMDTVLDEDSLLILDYSHFLSMHPLSSAEKQSALIGDHGLTFDRDGQEVFLLTPERLQVVSIQDPQQMKILGSVPLPAQPKGIKVREKIAYIACGTAGLVLVDLHDSNTPKILGRLSLEGKAQEIDLHGDYALVASGRAGLSVIDVSNPEDPVISGRLQLAPPLKDFSDFYDVKVKDDRAYIADLKNGLIVAQLGAKGAIQILAHLQTHGLSRQVSCFGSRVYIADLAGGVVVAEVTKEGRPRMIGRIPIPGLARQVEVSEGKVWVLSTSGSLLRMSPPVEADDVDSRSEGQLVARLPSPGIRGYYTLRIAGASGVQEIQGALWMDQTGKMSTSEGLRGNEVH